MQQIRNMKIEIWLSKTIIIHSYEIYINISNNKHDSNLITSKKSKENQAQVEYIDYFKMASGNSRKEKRKKKLILQMAINYFFFFLER